MPHMELETTAKGVTYSVECTNCGGTFFTHEWAHSDHNERRMSMHDGSLRCEYCCVGHADPTTFRREKDQYAARLSAPGYLDCTDWEFGTNRRELERQVRNG